MFLPRQGHSRARGPRGGDLPLNRGVVQAAVDRSARPLRRSPLALGKVSRNQSRFKTRGPLLGGVTDTAALPLLESRLAIEPLLSAAAEEKVGP